MSALICPGILCFFYFENSSMVSSYALHPAPRLKYVTDGFKCFKDVSINLTSLMTLFQLQHKMYARGKHSGNNPD